MTIWACISGSAGLIGYSIYPDGYVTFPASLVGHWTDCTVTIRLKEDDGDDVITPKNYNCLDRANDGGTGYYGSINYSRNGIGVPCPISYYTQLSISGHAGGLSLSGSTLSPYENIAC